MRFLFWGAPNVKNNTFRRSTKGEGILRFLVSPIKSEGMGVSYAPNVMLVLVQKRGSFEVPFLGGYKCKKITPSEGVQKRRGF